MTWHDMIWNDMKWHWITGWSISSRTCALVLVLWKCCLRCPWSYITYLSLLSWNHVALSQFLLFNKMSHSCDICGLLDTFIIYNLSQAIALRPQKSYCVEIRGDVDIQVQSPKRMCSVSAAICSCDSHHTELSLAVMKKGLEECLLQQLCQPQIGHYKGLPTISSPALRSLVHRS